MTEWVMFFLGICVGGIISAVFGFNWAISFGWIVVALMSYSIYKKLEDKTK